MQILESSSQTRRYPWTSRCSMANPITTSLFFQKSASRACQTKKSIASIYRENRDRGYLCGSSNGWLLMATIGTDLKLTLFLWNPLNGSTRNLPSLTAHPCNKEFRNQVGGRYMAITRVFDRVTVFSHGSAECVVAVILNKRIYPRNRISFCTPQDKRWTTFGGKEDKAVYIDVMYHEKIGSLWLLTTGDLHVYAMETLRSCRNEVRLSECTVPVSFSFLDRIFRDVDMGLDRVDLPQHSLTLKKARQVFRLVEDTVHEDGDVLIAAADIDREFRVHYRKRAKEVMVRDRIGHVSFMVPLDENSSRFGELTIGIDNQTVFLGSACTDSIIMSGPVKGIETDCVYLAMGDSVGHCFRGNESRRDFLVREHGVYCLKSKKMKNRNSLNVSCYTSEPDKIGWLEPKIFLK